MRPGIYFREITQDTWDEFKRITEREGSSASRKIEDFVRDYVDQHKHGNPQTLILPFARGARPVVEKRVPMRECDYYAVTHDGKPYCNYDWGVGGQKPDRCYSCDTRKYLRP